ncbi:hypothetical protein GCM10007116_11060 [Sulfodiicoccus acidiphilus]|nr:hypothetical protein GCM10007116_11060 [Sulfodiicoccus acidiphilus]
MILKFKVNGRQVSFVESGKKSYLVVDLDIKCSKVLEDNLSYLDANLEDSGIKLVKLVFCTSSSETYLCSAVAETNLKVVSQTEAERVYDVISNLARRASPCTLLP